MIVIVRKDLKVHWMLNPAKKAYFERPLNEEEMQGSFNKTFNKGEEEDLGTETVSGYKCRKKRVNTATKFMGIRRQTQSTMWVSDKFDIPLRTKTSDGSVTELKNIKKGSPSKDLFELPAGYAKVEGFMELYGEHSEKERAEEAQPVNQDQGFKIPDALKDKLPKGFKLPFGNKE